MTVIIHVSYERRVSEVGSSILACHFVAFVLFGANGASHHIFLVPQPRIFRQPFLFKMVFFLFLFLHICTRFIIVLVIVVVISIGR